MESLSFPDLPTVEELGSLRPPEQYRDLLRSSSALSEDSVLGSHIRVVSRQDQNLRGRISIARAGSKRRKTDDESAASHGGQLTFQPAEDSDCHIQF